MKKFQMIYGVNHKRIEERAKTIASEYLDEVDDFSLVRFNALETSVEQLIEEAQTLPFLSNKKVIIYQDAYFFTGVNKKSDININVELLLEYFKQQSDDTLIIFTVFHEQLDKRKKVTKEVTKIADVIEIGEMNENELRNYVVDTLNTDGITIDDDALNELIIRTAAVYSSVVSELNKLVLYVEDTITLDDVKDVVSISLEQNIFNLTDYILTNQKSKAVELSRQLILQKQEPLQLLHLINTQFRLYYQVKIMMNEGYQQDFITRELGVHPYRVKLASKQVSKFTLDRLLQRIVKSRDMDYKFKSTYLDREALFELYLLEI